MPGFESAERQDHDECEVGVGLRRYLRKNLKTQSALRKAAENAEKILVFDQIRRTSSHVSQNRRDVGHPSENHEDN